MFFPIVAGYVAQYEGNSAMFCVLIAVLGTATTVVIVNRVTLSRLSTE